MTAAPDAGQRRPRSAGALLGVGLTGLLVFAALAALGVWQLERRVWKLDLIARVDQRIHAPPTPPPPPRDWPAVTAEHDEYRRVQVGGAFIPDRETLVQAVTRLGSGYWVLTPLRTDQGFIVLVNRGFTPADLSPPSARVVGQRPGHVTVTGLLRMTEPRGGFLRANDPAAGRWYSRDVQAIAAARGLSNVAPYFIDADATPNPGGWPAGGLTVIAFPNSHLIYAITWFSLAAMVAAGLILLVRDERRLRRAPTNGP